MTAVEPHLVYSILPSPEHHLPGHPEGPHRLMEIERKLLEQFPDQLARVDPVPISMELLHQIHPQAYVEAIREAAEKGPGFVDYGDTYVTPASYQAALLASGTVVEVAQSVLEQPARTGFALIRPPGHHAFSSKAEGFCLFNNIAIAAEWLKTQGIHRLVIVDFDVHHGNGTEALFAGDPEVLFFSTHQWGIYPGSGGFNTIGEGEGTGTVVNVPLPAGAGNAAFQQVYREILSPVVERFEPEIMLISAGFDAHWRDPLAGLTLSIEGYRQIAKDLKDLADQFCEGRSIFVLEGGYDPEVLFHGIATMMAVHLDEAYADSIGTSPGPEPGIADLIEKLRELHNLSA